jgi:alpha-D-ribose 1-methylphosphonate 5-triphosphate synthase subunit PhnG
MIDRHLWVQALAALPEADIKAAADRARSLYGLRHLSLPEEGLGLLKLKDGALGEPYYLGEFPVASAHVELVDENRNCTVAGGAHVLHDSAEYAVDLAVCDALLAGRWPGWEEVGRLLERGRQKLQERERRRKSMLARTRVDFDLLSKVREEDHDD